ncbi:MAG TPA: methyltransferase domain-containing protein [Kofleriaceae bacterium]|nr:methyltransferase domain-containing protein [Kofleriaceae bacterium]
MRATLFDEVGIAKGMKVLELGCGTGVVARQLAHIVGPTGHVVAVDCFQRILDYAKRIGGVHGGAPIEYMMGEAETFAGMSGFDAVIAMTLLGCVESVPKVIANMSARAKPGGMVMVFDQDYESLIFDHSDVKLTRKIVDFGAMYNIRNPTVGRTLAAEMVRSKVKDVGCWGWVYTERDAGSYMITLADRYAQLAIEHDVVSKDVAEKWLAEIQTRGREGTFFASINYYCSWGHT